MIRYPVYIPSKGRAEIAQTPAALKLLGVPYKLVVEPPEAEAYAQRWGRNVLLVLPFHDLGRGSIPARNWIWDHAVEHGHDRHWVIDDNIDGFVRLNHNRRINVASDAIFRAVEDFTDRYDNLAFSGFNYRFFADARISTKPPITWNTRVYSATLLDSALPYRWRGRYNEDTDLCLRALKDGRATALFNAFLANKMSTLTMGGGNTDNVYNTGDHRLEFAESLKQQHPDVVRVVWRYGRWHHHVDYSRFNRNDPQLREDITPRGDVDEYGMTLRRGNWRDIAQMRVGGGR